MLYHRRNPLAIIVCVSSPHVHGDLKFTSVLFKHVRQLWYNLAEQYIYARLA